jgi:hypothetical protein
MFAMEVRQQMMAHGSGLAWRSISVVILLCWLPAAQALSLDQNSASQDSKAQQPQTCGESGRAAFTTQAEFVLIGAVLRCPMTGLGNNDFIGNNQVFPNSHGHWTPRACRGKPASSGISKHLIRVDFLCFPPEQWKSVL